MPLLPKTLDAIQTAGATAFKADALLKDAVKDYAAQVQSAMSQNPFDAVNDNLFEDWKSVCRLSQAMAQIEVELRNIYAAAAGLQTPALTAPKTKSRAAPVAATATTLEVVTQVEAVDVVAKKPRKIKRKITQKAKSTGPLPSNATTLLAHLTRLLNPNSFEKVNQSSIALDIGMPKGSIGASMIKLVKEGFLAQDPALGFKLTPPQTNAA